MITKGLYDIRTLNTGTNQLTSSIFLLVNYINFEYTFYLNLSVLNRSAVFMSSWHPMSAKYLQNSHLCCLEMLDRICNSNNMVAFYKNWSNHILILGMGK